MNWLELTILYLAIGCAVGMWLTFKDLRRDERLPSKVIKRFLFWPAYLLSLSKRKSRPIERLSVNFDESRYPDAKNSAENLLSEFPEFGIGLSFFEFRDDLERYVGLRINQTKRPVELNEFFSIGGEKPTEAQTAVVLRNQERKLGEHIERARESLVQSMVKVAGGENRFVDFSTRFFKAFDDSVAMLLLKQSLEEHKVLSDESVDEEVLPWIQERKAQL